jgi:hypothetical protein
MPSRHDRPAGQVTATQILSNKNGQKAASRSAGLVLAVEPVVHGCGWRKNTRAVILVGVVPGTDGGRDAI